VNLLGQIAVSDNVFYPAKWLIQRVLCLINPPANLILPSNVSCVDPLLLEFAHASP